MSGVLFVRNWEKIDRVITASHNICVSLLCIYTVWNKTKFGSQNFGYQIWSCTKLYIVPTQNPTIDHGCSVKRHMIFDSELQCRTFSCILVSWISSCVDKKKVGFGQVLLILYRDAGPHKQSKYDENIAELNSDHRVLSTHPVFTYLNQIEAEVKWPPFCRQHFKMNCLVWKFENCCILIIIDWNMFLRIRWTRSQHWVI